MNKKGFVLTGMMIVAFVVIIGIIAFLSSATLRFTIIGIAVMVGTFIYAIPAALQGDFTTKKIYFILSLFAIGGLIIAVPYMGLVGQSVFNTEEINLAVPVMASFKCEKIGSATGLVYNIEKSGLMIRAEHIGFWTPSIDNIKVTVPKRSINIARIKYKICNIGCTEKILTFTGYAESSQNIPDLDVKNGESITIWYETKSGLNPFSSWAKDSGATVSYSADKYGITLSSTTRDPAGAKICLTTCDLNCLSQGYREKLVYDEDFELLPEETAPYLEYWNSIDFDLNSQGGATVYDETKNEFCLGGDIYKAGEIITNNDIKYVYPKTFLRTESCCPGAVIAITNGNKYCTDDYNWKEITKDTRIPCISDINCPGTGKKTCQKIGTEYITNSWGCGSDNFCDESKDVKVDCCPVDLGCLKDEICQTPEYKCVGGSTQGVPIDTTGNVTEIKLKCGFGQELQIVESKDYGILGWRNIFNNPIVNVKTECKTSGWVFGLIIAGAFTIITVTIIITSKKGKRRRRK